MNERKESLPNDDYIGETSICRKLRLKSMKLLTLKVPEILSVPGVGGGLLRSSMLLVPES